MSTLEYLRKHIDHSLTAADSSHMQFPPPIAKTLGFELTHVALGEAEFQMHTEPARHANPMGTIHGGVLCDIADMAIGTAHATMLKSDESFTTIDLRINFFRPLWDARIVARAQAVHRGVTMSYYECRITREDGKLVATVTSSVMTLRGEQSKGR
jgi:uncharacterized protein (TIGR00369 family)